RWREEAPAHVFLTTCCDGSAAWRVTDTAAFAARREAAFAIPYRLCQRWMQQRIDDGRMGESSLVTVVRGGGSFGIQPDGAVSNESGAMAGLTKAMLIEAWMRGHRDTPMLVVDAPNTAAPRQVIDGIFRELAVPSYDEEVVVDGETRLAVAASHAPLEALSAETTPKVPRFPLTRGGTWVVAGGGRGITAMTAMALAERHDMKLHLLGMAPPPNIDATTREHAQRDRADLRRVTMRRLQAEGKNPVKLWRQMEKAIEIDLTLQDCLARGIQATYHSVNIRDAAAVDRALVKIRQADGAIHGVIQGAGSGQDARFDRKRPDKVDQCLSAKIDGTVALAAATQHDPLEWFVGFGSISGRFGANGHTDYSAANDALAKLIGELGRLHPNTRCLTFHWHAWGDVGMATKPEAKLALDMIGMEFMPADEGLAHFLRELEQGGDAAEVLITDRRYVRKFFPCGEDDEPFAAPLLMPNLRANESDSFRARTSHTVTLDPTRDLFLMEHLVGEKPTLPMAVALEMMAQAAALQTGETIRQVLGLRAIAPLKCHSDDAFALELVQDADDRSDWHLTCALRRKDGRLVEAGKRHFSARFSTEAAKDLPDESPVVPSLPQSLVEYLPPEAPVYHGPPLRCLRTIGFATSPAAKNIPIAVGTIVAPSPAHLAGEHRPLSGWVTSPATFDAMLYAAGMLAGHVGGRASLPVSMDRVELGRLPTPGEPLEILVRWLVDTEDGSGGILSATLTGQNKDLITRLVGYRVAWIG
ncbi:MAG: SDR family oxidoreductase, partial [Planctomycetota bacterium]